MRALHIVLGLIFDVSVSTLVIAVAVSLLRGGLEWYTYANALLFSTAWVSIATQRKVLAERPASPAEEEA